MAYAAPAGASATPSDANITGHVIDSSTGEHLAYSTVRIDGTSIATLTDASGHYTIRDLKPGNYEVVASFVGYKSVPHKVDAERDRTIEVNFDLSPDAFMLDQVVVTASKSEQKRRNSPSLVSVASAKLLEQVSACSLADGLSFQPGVRVENDC